MSYLKSSFRITMIHIVPVFQRTVVLFLLLLFAGSFIISPITAAGPGNGSWIAGPTELNITNHSVSNAWEQSNFSEGPTPVSVFRAELNESTLPGPRYMGFGPSTISIAVDPRILAVIFAIVLIGLVIWFVSFRSNVEDDRKDGKNE
jgi:hypothetical protein